MESKIRLHADMQLSLPFSQLTTIDKEKYTAKVQQELPECIDRKNNFVNSRSIVLIGSYHKTMKN